MPTNSHRLGFFYLPPWDGAVGEPSPNPAPQGFLGLQNLEPNKLLWFINQPGSVILMDQGCAGQIWICELKLFFPGLGRCPR